MVACGRLEIRERKKSEVMGQKKIRGSRVERPGTGSG